MCCTALKCKPGCDLNQPLLIPSSTPVPLLVPSSFPVPLLVPSSSPVPLLVLSSFPERPRESALLERPQEEVPLQCPCWFHPALQCPCWFRPALQSTPKSLRCSSELLTYREESNLGTRSQAFPFIEFSPELES